MQQMYSCPNCKAPVAYGQSACGNCGIPLDWGAVQQAPPPDQTQQAPDQQQMWQQQIYSCPSCGAPVSYGQSVCSNCSIPLDWGAVQQTTGQGRSNQYQQQNRYSGIMTILKKKRLGGISIPILALIFVVIVAGGIVFALNSDSLFTSTKPPDDQTTASTSTEFKKPPFVESFSAESSKITQGQETKLSWNVSGATSVSIDQGIGTVSPSGTQVVSPTENTTYRLTATNSAGPVNATVTITVTEPPEPGIITFSASQSSITIGSPVTLQWKVARASYIIIDPDIGIVSPVGKQVVTLSKTTTYTLTATNADGSATASVKITVADSGAPIINSFTATPATIAASDNSTLQWDISGANSISIDPNIGNVLASGSKIVSPDETITYTLTARNNAGTVTESVTITVATPGAPVIDSFYASPVNITEGNSSTLQWNISGATSISIDPGGYTDLDATGSQTVSPTATTTYTITATNDHDTVTRQAKVTVGSGDPPEIESFTASTYSGGQSTLHWKFNGIVTSASIVDDDGQQVPGDLSFGQITVYPIETTTYTLTASNNYGSVSDNVTVTVP